MALEERQAQEQEHGEGQQPGGEADPGRGDAGEHSQGVQPGQQEHVEHRDPLQVGGVGGGESRCRAAAAPGTLGATASRRSASDVDEEQGGEQACRRPRQSAPEANGRWRLTGWQPVGLQIEEIVQRRTRRTPPGRTPRRRSAPRATTSRSDSRWSSRIGTNTSRFFTHWCDAQGPTRDRPTGGEPRRRRTSATGHLLSRNRATAPRRSVDHRQCSASIAAGLDPGAQGGPGRNDGGEGAIVPREPHVAPGCASDRRVPEARGRRRANTSAPGPR